MKNNSIEIVEPRAIYAEAEKGSHIKNCIGEAFALAKEESTPVLLMFNREVILIRDDSNLDEILKKLLDEEDEGHGTIVLTSHKKD